MTAGAFEPQESVRQDGLPRKAGGSRRGSTLSPVAYGMKLP